MVELGAATMLPCLAAAAKYPDRVKCFATDLKKVMPLVEQCHQLNDSPANIVPLELAWGDQSHLQRLEERLVGKPIDYIICSDIVYDEDYFTVLLETLVLLSQVNVSPTDGNSEPKYPVVYLASKIRDPAYYQPFFDQFNQQFRTEHVVD